MRQGSREEDPESGASEAESAQSLWLWRWFILTAFPVSGKGKHLGDLLSLLGRSFLCPSEPWLRKMLDQKFLLPG